MARIWSSGAEFGSLDGNNKTIISFVGGIRDGVDVELKGELPPYLICTSLRPSPFSQEKPVKYKRLRDTVNYICTEWFSSEENEDSSSS